VLDWMTALRVPLMLVAGSYLGTISHTLTALHVLARRNLTTAAVVVSETPGSTVPLDDTVASIARFADGIDVIALPRLAPDTDPQPAFARLAQLL
jgi:dethiobiotin synthetase